MGIGFGYVASPGVIVAQSSVGWEHRGVATGTNMFSRSVGSAVGVAVFGAIVNSRLAGGAPSGSSLDLEHLSAGVLAPAIHAVFVCSAVVVAGAAAVRPADAAPGRRRGVGGHLSRTEDQLPAIPAHTASASGMAAISSRTRSADARNDGSPVTSSTAARIVSTV